jgi:hypothetical protein
MSPKAFTVSTLEFVLAIIVVPELMPKRIPDIAPVEEETSS